MMKNESFENKSDFQIVRKTFSQLIVIFYNTQKKEPLIMDLKICPQPAMKTFN